MASDHVFRMENFGVISCDLAAVPVRAVRLTGKYVLAAVGQFLKVYLGKNLVRNVHVFDDQVIHAILVNFSKNSIENF